MSAPAVIETEPTAGDVLAAHVVTLDYSPETGTIAACTCGLVLGPYNEYAAARSAAVEHRRAVGGGEVIGSEERRRERNRQQTARRAAARRAAREES